MKPIGISIIVYLYFVMKEKVKKRMVCKRKVDILPIKMKMKLNDSSRRENSRK